MFDEFQKKAIELIDGPVLCAAGPGSGKTTVIVNRTLNMVKNGIDPKTIIVMTFTTDAAKEMESRYENLEGSVKGPSFCTIHSFAYMVCRECYGYTGDSVLKISEAMKFVKKYLREKANLFQNVTDLKKTTELILGDISRFSITKDKNAFRPSAVSKKDFNVIYKEYSNYKNSLGKIDFDDMLLLCRTAILQEDIKAHYQERYKYIMVDEYQDTSEVQADIIYALADKYKNIFVCGDDDQSIYGFRNAKPQLMINFSNDFPGATVIKLSVNYRSDVDIVGAAQSLITNNKVRIGKDIRGNKTDSGIVATMRKDNSKEQNRSLVEFIKEKANDTPYTEMAILCRTNKEISVVAKCLSDNDIPFVTKEQINNIHNTWLFETLIAYIKIAYKKAERGDYITAALKPSRYFKKTFLEETGADPKEMKKKCFGNKFLYKSVCSYEEDIENVIYIAENYKFGEAVKKISKYILGVRDWIADTCEFQRLNLEDYMNIYEECLLEMEDFNSLEEYIAYVDEKDSIFEENVHNTSDEGVTIATMHRAKGREWDIVMVTSVNTGNIPYIKSSGDDEEHFTKESEEEERRLFYVAITRARKICAICFTEEKGDKPKSYFLNEIEENKKVKLKTIDVKACANKESSSDIAENRSKRAKKKYKKTKPVVTVTAVPHVPVTLDDSCPVF